VVVAEERERYALDTSKSGVPLLYSVVKVTVPEKDSVLGHPEVF
jgi:hypothetical protein